VAGLVRVVHPPGARIFWQPARAACPDMSFQVNAPPANGRDPEEAMALSFVDPRDGEAHVFLFTEEGRQNLLRLLTAGVIVPGAGGIPPESRG
jgi:hypothetical protein